MFWRKKKKEIVTEVTPEIQKEEHLEFNFNDFDNDIQLLKAWNIENAIIRKPSIAMDSAIEQAYQPNFDTVNQDTISYFIRSSSFIGYQAMSVIGQHWLVNKGCHQKIRDALKKWYELSLSSGDELTPEKANKIHKADKKYRLKHHIISSVAFNNIFGIRHILFKHKNPNFNYEKPFNPDAFRDGQYAGIREIDPYWCVPEIDTNDMSDPLSMNFYSPEFWIVKGRRIHKSHMVILRGEEVADILKPSYRYGGISMCQRIYERAYSADRCANESPQLLMTKRLNARKVNLEKAQANKEAFMKNIMQANKYRDNHGWLLYGKEEEIVQMETNLSQVSDVITNQFELVSAILDIPVSKLLGSGHKGFSTGETDEDYYISSLEAVQTDVAEVIIQEHYKRLIPSLFDDDFELDLIWNKLKVMSDKDIADMNYVKSQTALNEFNIGAIDGEDERDRIIKDKDSQYNGIEEKDASQLLPPSTYQTPNNQNGTGQNNSKDVNGKQQKNPSKNSTND